MDINETPAPRRWTSTVAGAVAGGLLAASIAVPGTWALTRDDESAPVASSTTTTTTTSTNQADSHPGVVLIGTALTDGEAAGTGLVIDSSGLVLTNYHVVEGSTSVQVTIADDGTTYDAEVVGFDQKSDIALLRLDGASGLTTVDLDDDGDPAVSDTVTAVGNAEGQGYLSESSGTVVALDQSISTQSSGPVLGEHLTGLIETNAYVVGGYSGGALLDDEDEVVGLTTAASSGQQAESYAIPIADALAIADQIEAGNESGDVQVGPSAYLGIGVVETGTGLGVARVEGGTAADRAGIVAGDVLPAVGGRTVGSLEVLKDALASYQPGDRVTLHWTDGTGQAQHARVTLGSSPVN